MPPYLKPFHRDRWLDSPSAKRFRAARRNAWDRPIYDSKFPVPRGAKKPVYGTFPPRHGVGAPVEIRMSFTCGPYFRMKAAELFHKGMRSPNILWAVSAKSTGVGITVYNQIHRIIKGMRYRSNIVFTHRLAKPLRYGGVTK